MTHNSLTDKEYYQLTISIGKAFNSFEAPVKSKHVRAAIIGTYHSNGGHAFWAIAIRQPMQDNRITAWKFCHVLHKILREGHPLVIQHSMRHRSMITELGKLWGHLNDGYGLCIKQYTKLLVTKLNFHDRNPRFPGNLVLKRGELDRIAENDINVYFQLAVEMFDYLDDIVALQATIFNAITTFAVSSMTASGQCRLAPLIPCIQDSNQLYDFVVRLMFLLHANLPDDLLNGHRERFRTLFRQLNNFYKQAGQLQYFHNLIKVPSLPSNPPNFLVQSDLGNYTAPVVVVPQESHDGDNNSIVENLVDTSSAEPELPPRRQTPPPPPLPSIDFDSLLKERDELIRQMQHEMEKQHQMLRATTMEKREYEHKVQEHVAKMNSELTQTQHELTNMRLQKEEIELKMQSAPILEQKVLAEEERAKTSEEKFQKLKNMYTQIRDEHIKLLRQHGEVNKQLAENTKSVSDATKEKEELKAKLMEIEIEQTKVTETLQQSSSATKREKEELSDKVKELEMEKLSLMDKLSDIESAKCAEIAELKINLDSLQKSLDEMRENSLKLQEEKAHLEQEYQDVSNKKSDAENSYQQTLVSLERLAIVEAEKLALEEESNNQKVEAQSLSLQIEQKTSEYEALEIKLNEQIETSTKEIEGLQTQLHGSEKKYQDLVEKVKELEMEKLLMMDKLSDVETAKCAEITELKINLDSLQKSLDEMHENSSILQEEKAHLEQEYQDLSNKKNETENSYQQTLESLVICESIKLALEEENNSQKAEAQSLSLQVEQKTSENEALEIKLNEQIETSTKVIEDLQTQLQENEEKYQSMSANYDRVLSEKETFETDIQDLLHQQEQLDHKHNEALLKIQQLELELVNSKIHGETALRALLEACIKTSEKITLRAIAESETPGASGTSTYFIMIAEELQDVLTKLKIVHENYLKDNNNNVEALVRKVQSSGHLLASVHEQGYAVCNKSKNIDTGEKIATEIKSFGQSTSEFFESLHTSSKSDLVNSQIDGLKEKLYKITNMIGDLTNNNDDIDQLGDMVEKELSSMDKAIEEAAQRIVDMLTQTKTSDSGLKLEVNEKILDACTTLMRSIQILVQKSRKVQAEIIALGKGTASAKEFYKRNHQWTEGLISAAKSVANGAKFLVDAANKAVSGESKHTLDIVVAAQEIAACTAQLVVASRVKAPRSSQNLQELTTASKNVTQSTGIVVATAKDCSQRLEEGQDLDFTKLTLHQAKTKEMEVQVKVLELEQALQVERMRLSALRRQNYQAME